jgi:hypothetical protein
LEGLVDGCLMDGFRAREIVWARTSRNLPQWPFPSNIGFRMGLRMK